MMQQYRSIKNRHKDAVLFFRLGDFYEMFDHDAREVSSLLNLTLTRRNGVPMCGIPCHASRGYIARLLQQGKKIAICEQVSMPSGGRGIARREVVEIITPGTVTDESYLDRGSNNYLLAVGRRGKHLSMSWIDLSTGEFFAASYTTGNNGLTLSEVLARLSPREVIIQESLLEEDREVSRILGSRSEITVNRFPDWSFDMDDSRTRLLEQLGVGNLKAFGLEEDSPEIYACGPLLAYLHDTAKTLLPHIRSLNVERSSEHLGLDESSIRNLELLKNLQDGAKKFSLLDVIDFTITSMGSRTLKSWILAPLQDTAAIKDRLDMVESLYRNQRILSSVREILKDILDLERLSARTAMNKAHAKDLLAIKDSIEALHQLEGVLKDWKSNRFSWTDDRKERDNIAGLCALLERSIAENPSILLTEGNLIQEGYDEELDKLRDTKQNGHRYLKEYLASEKDETGIPSLKVKYNRVIGYFLEVTKPNLHLVPAHFIRRQTLVGSERYTTERLVELETEINNASDMIIEREKELFLEIRDKARETVPLLLKISGFLAELDCYASFAQCATERGYVKPTVNNGPGISIREGRHPVVEAYLPPGEFIPNNTELDTEAVSFILITGPNMAGKSTYLRQTALIVLMAHIGSFVPASSAVLGLVDRIFCRVGASDNLARGESTFLVEMNEAAYILRNATRRSLIIMDEIGRGTSTNDGLSIAWAVSEYIMHRITAKTLFATHFHELTLMKDRRLKNRSLRIAEENGSIVFLKKVIEGPSGHSYGIQVARLAGVPEEVIHRAEEVLSAVLSSEKKELPAISAIDPGGKSSSQQGELFSREEMVRKMILSVDLNNTTPLEALKLLSEWQRHFKKNDTP